MSDRIPDYPVRPVEPNRRHTDPDYSGAMWVLLVILLYSLSAVCSIGLIGWLILWWVQ